MSTRLDRELAARGLARSRSHAQDLINQGKVSVDAQPVTRPSQIVTAAAVLTVDDPCWVSRGAVKLGGALADLGLTPRGRVLDAGASTGGFTQVLLGYRSVQRVYAVDVGHDQFDPKLRIDSRVEVREGYNLRNLTADTVDSQPLDWVVADVSFISLTKLVKPLLGVLNSDGVALLLVKPQFEVGRRALGKGGVVRDESQRKAAVDAVAAAADALGWFEQGRALSRLPGPAGNVEYFLHLRAQDVRCTRG